MIKKILKTILKSKRILLFIVKLLLSVDNKIYEIVSRLSILIEGGIHPKHRIIKYKEWFYRNISDGDIVLDIGCNNGSLVSLLSKKAKYVYGVDISSDLIKIAKEKHTQKNIEFFCEDATKTDYKKMGKIDKIILSNVLEHIKDRGNFLKELISSIKKNRNNTGTQILIRVPSIERDWLTVYKKEIGVFYFLDKTHYIEYSDEEIEKELTSYGLNIKLIEKRFGEIFLICNI